MQIQLRGKAPTTRQETRTRARRSRGRRKKHQKGYILRILQRGGGFISPHSPNLGNLENIHFQLAEYRGDLLQIDVEVIFVMAAEILLEKPDRFRCVRIRSPMDLTSLV